MDCPCCLASGSWRVLKNCFWLVLVLASCESASDVRDAGASCSRAKFGGLGRGGEAEISNCQAVRRSLPSIQSGEVVIPCSRTSPMTSLRHSFPKSFLIPPRVVLSVSNRIQDDGSSSAGPAEVNGTWTATVRDLDLSSFTANIYRVDGSVVGMTDGWAEKMILHYIAWEPDEPYESHTKSSKNTRDRRDAETSEDMSKGIQFGTADFLGNQRSQQGSPWIPDDEQANTLPLGAEPLEDDQQELSGFAAYLGGKPEVFRIDFPQRFDETPMALVQLRLISQFDKQACFSWTVRGIDLEGFSLNLVRVDQSWGVEKFAVDYIAWIPSLNTVTGPNMVNQNNDRPVSGPGSVTGTPPVRQGLKKEETGDCTRCHHRMAARLLDPYIMPRAQFGSHVLLPPVPTSAGFTNYTYPDSRWGSDVLAAGQGLGQRGARLPSSVVLELSFEFKDVFVAKTPFNFTRPPYMLVTPRIFYDLVPENNEAVRDTLSVSVTNITSKTFTVSLYRTDRDGSTWPDRGGRGWLKHVAIDWIAWEPFVEDFSVLQPGVPFRARLMADRYTFFRINVFDDTHDLVVLVNETTTTGDISGTNLAINSGWRRPIAWLPHHVFPVAGPPSDPSLIVPISSSAPPEMHTVKYALQLLNEDMIDNSRCSGGFAWDDKFKMDPLRTDVSCGERADLEGGKVWPYSEAYVFETASQQWHKLECAGIGCPHRLSRDIAPLLMIASPRVTHPTREFIGTALPDSTPENSRQSTSRSVSGAFVSNFLEGGSELRIYATDRQYRSGRFYIGVLGLLDANITITAHVGKMVPLGGSVTGQVVPYRGQMLVGRQYSGSVVQGAWTYFRLSLSGLDLSQNRAITQISIQHAKPTDILDLYIRKDQAPADQAEVPNVMQWLIFANETFTMATWGLDWRPTSTRDWVGVSGISSCGSFGSILGGHLILGHGSGITKIYVVPQKHTVIRVRFGIVKIDLWDGERVALLIDDIEVWSHTFVCDISVDGMCGNSSSGSLECGLGERPDEMVEVDMDIKHTRPLVKVQIKSSLPAVDAYARDKSWGMQHFSMYYRHENRRTAAWVDSDTLLFSSNSSIPPSDAEDFCTLSTGTNTPACQFVNETLSCVDGLCSQRNLFYRLPIAGEYFVGVYGRNVSSSSKFIVKTSVVSDVAPVPGARDPSIVADLKAIPLALIQTYPRVSVAHGPGVSIALTGVPATFYIRSKDKYGNLRTAGGDLYNLSFIGPCGIDGSLQTATTCQSELNSPSPAVNVFDLEDGNYFAMYTLTAGGRYTMNIKLNGIHIRGSPFQITTAPDAELLATATGSTWMNSNIRTSSAVPVTSSVGERMYTYFAADVPDMVSDLIVELEVLDGKVDVLISNTITHPAHNAPADVQWKSENININGTRHRIHIRYTDPLFLAGGYYIGIYGQWNSTFVINATTEQVARDMEINRLYGAVISSAGSCASDSDCSAADGFLCIEGSCRQRRRFRFVPEPSKHAHHIRVQMQQGSVQDWVGGLVSTQNITQPNCTGLQVFLTKEMPYPDGELIAVALAPDNSVATCYNKSINAGEVVNKSCELLCSEYRYTLTLSHEGCGGLRKVSHLGHQSAVGCIKPVDALAMYFVTVQTADKNQSAALSIRYQSSHLSSVTAEEVFAPKPSDHPRRTNAEFVFKNLSNYTELSHGQFVAGYVDAGVHNFYSAYVPDTQSEIICTANSTDGRTMLFMSTTDSNPVRSRSSAVKWRSDTSVSTGQAESSVRARPTDNGFKIGTFFIAVYGYTNANYVLVCNISSITHVPTVRVGGTFAGTVPAGGYAFFRLAAEGVHYSLEIRLRLKDPGALYYYPNANTSQSRLAGRLEPLGLYIQRDNPSASASTLSLCSAEVRTNCAFSIKNSSCAECGYPYDSDIDRINYDDYTGQSWIQAKLQAGSVYYIAAESKNNTQASFSLQIIPTG